MRILEHIRKLSFRSWGLGLFELPTARAVPGVQAIAASWRQTVIAVWIQSDLKAYEATNRTQECSNLSEDSERLQQPAAARPKL